jgi:hypothetical protein
VICAVALFDNVYTDYFSVMQYRSQQQMKGFMIPGGVKAKDRLNNI